MRGVHSSLMMMLYDEQLDVFPTRPAPPSQHAEFWSCPLRQMILNSSGRVPSCFFPLCNRFPRLGCHLVGSGVLAERIYKLAEGVHEVEEDAGSLLAKVPSKRSPEWLPRTWCAQRICRDCAGE
jgi:hypothetical protein